MQRSEIHWRAIQQSNRDAEQWERRYCRFIKTDAFDCQLLKCKFTKNDFNAMLLMESALWSSRSIWLCTISVLLHSDLLSHNTIIGIVEGSNAFEMLEDIRCTALFEDTDVFTVTFILIHLLSTSLLSSCIITIIIIAIIPHLQINLSMMQPNPNPMLVKNITHIGFSSTWQYCSKSDKVGADAALGLYIVVDQDKH